MIALCCSCLFFSSRRRHTRYWRDWSSDVCSSDLVRPADAERPGVRDDSRREDAQERTLPGAVRAHEAEDLAPADREAHVCDAATATFVEAGFFFFFSRGGGLPKTPRFTSGSAPPFNSGSKKKRYGGSP